MTAKTVTRYPIALDADHLAILKALQTKFQKEEDPVISRSEVVRRALVELAKANDIQH